MLELYKTAIMKTENREKNTANVQLLCQSKTLS